MSDKIETVKLIFYGMKDGRYQCLDWETFTGTGPEINEHTRRRRRCGQHLAIERTDPEEPKTKPKLHLN